MDKYTPKGEFLTILSNGNNISNGECSDKVTYSQQGARSMQTCLNNSREAREDLEEDLLEGLKGKYFLDSTTGDMIGCDSVNGNPFECEFISIDKE